MFTALLETRRIDLNARNASGQTVAMIAVINGHAWMIGGILADPAFDQNVRNNRGETLLDVIRSVAALRAVRLPPDAPLLELAALLMAVEEELPHPTPRPSVRTWRSA
jgi:hypothetical protein